jgi:hypothetical protein
MDRYFYSISRGKDALDAKPIVTTTDPRLAIATVEETTKEDVDGTPKIAQELKELGRRTQRDEVGWRRSVVIG